MPKFTARFAILFLVAGAHAQLSTDPDGALRRELEQASARARDAAQEGDFDAFMRQYEPPKGLAVGRDDWQHMRGAAIRELARPAGASFLRAVRRGWWAGYFFGEARDGGVRITMHRFHMGEYGWRVVGQSAVLDVPAGSGEADLAARVRSKLEAYPPFRLPD